MRARMPVILLALALVPLASWVASTRQTATYEATSRAFLGQGAVPGDVVGRLRSAYKAPERAVKTQAELAHTPAVAARVLAAVPAKGGSARRLLKDTSITTATGGDVLAFSVRDSDPLIAQRLATQYARQYALFRRGFDRLPLEQALRELRADRRSGSPPGVQARKLQTLQAVAAGTAIGIEPAASAVKVRPKTAQNVIAGLLLGGLFGLGLAFLWDALDTRVQNSEEIATELDLRELAAIPLDPAGAARVRPAMLDEPGGSAAEAFRFLRAAVQPEFERGARGLLVTSALPAEGRSTVASNLALALARAGHDVVLADVDFRRPAVARLFDLEGRPGLTDIALGTVGLEDALCRVDLREAEALAPGSLRVLTAGSTQVPVGEFWTTRAFTRILESVTESCGVAVFDGPPLLGAGEAVPLAQHVDGILLTARLGALRRPALTELRRVLPTLEAPTLGFVAVGGQPRVRAPRGLVLTGGSAP